MLDLATLCAVAIRSVYWLVLLACNFLGYSPVWVKNKWKKHQQEEISRSLKIPHHLAIAYSEKSVQEEIYAFFDCCLTAGIRRVTMYDPFDELVKIIDKLKVMGKIKNILVFRENFPPSPNDYKLAVQIVPADYGRRSLVESCKTLSRTSSTVSINSVSSVLYEKFSLSEPELLIQVGQTPSLAGYPPWTLRITEFVQVRSLPNTRFQFEDILFNFNKRDIRIGK